MESDDSDEDAQKKKLDKKLHQLLDSLKSNPEGINQLEEQLEEIIAQGANVNQEDKFTNVYPIHKAVRVGNLNILKLLLQNRACIYQTDQKKHNAIYWAKHYNQEQAHRLLLEHEATQISLPTAQATLASTSKRSHSPTPAKVDDTKRTVEEQADLVEKYSKKGLSLTMHGNMFQLKLLMLYLIRATQMTNNGELNQFFLATEMDDAEKFDDVVIKFEKKDESKIQFLQAKHRQQDGKMINSSDLQSEDGDFSLTKYFKSFRKIMENSKFHGTEKEFVLCTNASLQEKLQTDPLTIKCVMVSNNIPFLFPSFDSKAKSFKIVIDNEIRDKLKNCSDHALLAHKLASDIFKGNQLNLKDPLYQKFHRALFQDKILTKVAKDACEFHNDFQNDNLPNIPDRVKSFKKHFFEFCNHLAKSAPDFTKTFKSTHAFGGYQMCDLNNLNVTELAKEWAALIVSAVKNKSKSIRIDRRKYNKSNTTFIENLEKLSGHAIIKVSESYKDRFKFREILFRDDMNTSVPKKVADFWTQLKQSLAKVNFDLGNAEVFEFIIADYQGCTEDELTTIAQVPEDYITDKCIDEFLNKFTLVCNYPNEEAMGLIISDEIKKLPEFQLKDTSLFNSPLQIFVLDWFKERLKVAAQEGRFLLATDGQQIIKNIMTNINTIITVGLSRRNTAEIDASEISLVSGNLESEINTVFENGEPELTLTFIKAIEPSIIAVRIYHHLQATAIKKTATPLKDDECIILTHNDVQISKTAELITRTVFASTTIQYLIITFSSAIVFRDFLSFFEKEIHNYDAITKPKQIVLIYKPENDEIAKSHKIKSRLNYLVDSSPCLLTVSGLQKILSRNVLFQGYIVILDNLFKNCNVNRESIFGPIILNELLNGKTLEICCPNENQNSSYYYISRKFRHYIYLQDSIQSETKAPPEFPYKLVYERNDFASKLKESNRPVYHIETVPESGKLILKAWRGPFYVLNQYINKKEWITLKEMDLFDYTLHQRIIIISDEAGMGKTQVLEGLRENFKEKDATIWFSILKLNELTVELDKAMNSNDPKDPKDLLWDLFSNSYFKPDTQNEFNRTVFDCLIATKNRMVVCFDGFDEISPTYEPVVINLINNLQQTFPLRNIIITTRHSTAPTLVEEFNACPLNLIPFSGPEQIKFLVKFWSHETKIIEKEASRLHSFAKILVQKYQDSISQNEVDICGIPLQTRLLAVVNEKDAIQFLRSEEEIPNVAECTDLINLYEKFTDKILERYFMEKTKWDITNVLIIKEMEEFKNKFLKQLEYAAIVHILNPETIASLKQYEKFPHSFDPIDADKGCGIINRAKDGQHFTFIHLTFAEFYVAKFLKHLLLLPNTIYRDIVKQVLGAKNFKMLRRFFDMLLAKDKPVLQQILKGNNINEKDIEVTDSEGRSPLHLTAANGFVKSLKHLVNSSTSEQIELKDRLFMLTPLEYAVQFGEWEAVEILLNIKANSGEIEFYKFKDILIECSIKNYENLCRAALQSMSDDQFLEIMTENQLPKLDTKCITPLDFAVRYQRNNIVSLLIGKLKSVLNIVCPDGSETAVLDNLNLKSGKTWTILHQATAQGNLALFELVTSHLKKWIDINVRDNLGNTPLHEAVYFQSFPDNKLRQEPFEEIIHRLIELGADLNMFNNQGFSSVTQAAFFQNPLAIGTLLEQGGLPDPDISEEFPGLTPLIAAVISGKASSVKLLLEKNVVLFAKGALAKWNITALHFAALLPKRVEDRGEIMKSLLLYAKRSNSDIINERCILSFPLIKTFVETCLHCYRNDPAIQNFSWLKRCLEMVEKIPGKGKFTAYDIACQMPNNLEVMKHLKLYGGIKTHRIANKVVRKVVKIFLSKYLASNINKILWDRL